MEQYWLVNYKGITATMTKSSWYGLYILYKKDGQRCGRAPVNSSEYSIIKELSASEYEKIKDQY